MQILVRDPAGRAVEGVQKAMVEGRTVVRLRPGERLEVVDPATGRAPATVQALRGGPEGEDLVLIDGAQIVQIEGFFEMDADAASVDFAGGEAAQITPASDGLAAVDWASGFAFAMPDAAAAMTTMQAGAAANAAGASSASAAAAGGAVSGVAAATSSLGWWIAGGVAAAGAGAAIANNNDDDDALPPSYSLAANAENADEGADVLFTLTTTNVAPGTQYTYEISGVSASDIAGDVLTGTVTIDANGRAVIPVSLLKDLKTEGVETLTVTVAGQTAAVVVNDTSTTPQPTYSLAANAESANEGGDVLFTLTTTNVAPGTQFEYQISGVSSDDVVDGALTGTVSIDANGRAVIPVSLLEDLKTEGVETLTVTVAGQTVSVTVNDTSTTPPFILTPGLDDLKGAASDDLVYGKSETYNPGDKLDGGAGYDTLNLVLDGDARTAGVNVSNVEQVSLQSFDPNNVVEFNMSGYDGAVGQINIAHSTGELDIVDQQSVADLSITDSQTLGHVRLDYDSQVVSGDSDTLNMIVDEVGRYRDGGESDATEVDVHSGVEALNLTVADGLDEASALELNAAGVTSLNVSGGVAGQGLHLDIDINGLESGAKADAKLDAREFAGDLRVEDIDGGVARFAYAIEIDRSLQVGETATLTVDGRIYAVTLDALTTGESFELTVNGKSLHSDDIEEDFSGESFTAFDLGGVFAGLLEQDGFSIDGGRLDPETDSAALIIKDLDAPLSITAEIVGEPIAVLDEFDYSDAFGLTSEELQVRRYSEVSNVQLGSGDDYVEVDGGEDHGNITHFDSYDLGAGNNTLKVDGDVFGAVTFGEGDGVLKVGESIGGKAAVRFDVGESSVVVAGSVHTDASIGFAGGSNTVAAAGGLADRASVTFNGDGENTLDLSWESEYGDIADAVTVAFSGAGDNHLIAGDIVGSAGVSFGDGNNIVEAGDIRGEATLSFGDGGNVVTVRGEDEIRNSASLTFGDGDNELNVGGLIRGPEVSIEFGDGSNTLTAGDDVDRAILSFGDGDNVVFVTGELQSTAVTFGAGVNSLEIGDDVRRSNLDFGDGGNTVSVSDELHDAHLTFGAGADSLFVGDYIKGGSTIDFDGGDDELHLGNGQAGAAQIRGQSVHTVVDLGDGDDSVTITADSDGEGGSAVLVGSGGFLEGGAGADTLTIRAVDDVEVVTRSAKQQASVTFNGEYAVGDVVSVVIDGVTFSYTVQASDIVQGNGSQTAVKVANGLAAAISDDERTPALSVDTDGAGLVLKGEKGDADVEVSSVGGTVEVVRIADARISGFETLNLVAGDPSIEGEEASDDDCETAHISADFDLISGVETINLSSEVRLSEEIRDEGMNGAYVRGSSGDAARFELYNLTSDLSDAITISADEVTATGNRQVERLWLDGEAGMSVGDVLTVSIGDQDYSVTVTAEDLAGETGVQDALNVLNRLAEAIEGESAFTVAVDQDEGEGMLTLIGAGDENEDIGFGVTNAEGEHLEYGDLDDLQGAKAADDANGEGIDVYIGARLSEEADTDSDTLTLKLNGTGDFDIAIDADGSEPEPVAYENLVLEVQDEHSHYIDTDADGDDKEFVRGSITLNGGAAGASIVIDDAVAKTVISTSAADVTVAFDENAQDAVGEDGPDYAISVTTLGGDDVVDMSGITLTRLGQIDLGEGTDRLIIGNSRQEADAAAGGSSELDLDRMFRNVSGVEELEVHIYGEDKGEDGELDLSDEIVLDDDAYETGIERLYVADGSVAAFQVGDGFGRALIGEIGDNVATTFDIHNNHDVTLEAEDDLKAEFRLHTSSSGDLMLTAAEEADVFVLGEGGGAITLHVGDDSDVNIVQFGEGDVMVSGGYDSEIAVEAGKSAVAVTAAAENDVFVETSGESDADVSVTQTGSDWNSIILAGLNDAQNVSVDITAYGRGEATLIKTFREDEGWDSEANEWNDFEGEANGDFNTHLEVWGEGGIDTLTLHSRTDENGEVSASGAIDVVVDDAWAVGDGPGEGADFTLDASALVAAEGDGAVFVNATQEDDATLKLIGSMNSTNILLGGELADTLVGGEGADVLYGGARLARSYQLYFDEVEGDVGFELDADGQSGEPAFSISATGSYGEGEAASVSADAFAEAFEALLSGGEGIVAAGGEYTYSGSDGNGDYTINLNIEGGPLEDLQEAFVGISVDASINDDDEVYLQFESSENLHYTIDDGAGMSMDEDRPPIEAHGAADVLEGGAGGDMYVIAYSQLDADAMTTIKGLDLGDEETGDLIQLGGSFEQGDYAIADFVDGEGLAGLWIDEAVLEIENVVNNGVASEITGPTLEAAVDTLFEANGVFETSGSASVNSAGLFSYGEDTYLIAVGGENGGFGVDDYIVKVTGFTGTLDVNDFYDFHPLSG